MSYIFENEEEQTRFAPIHSSVFGFSAQRPNETEGRWRNISSIAIKISSNLIFFFARKNKLETIWINLRKLSTTEFHFSFFFRVALQRVPLLVHVWCNPEYLNAMVRGWKQKGKPKCVKISKRKLLKWELHIQPTTIASSFYFFVVFFLVQASRIFFFCFLKNK